MGNFTACTGMRDRTGQLRGQRYQEGLFIFCKTAVLPLSHDQHTQHGSVLDDGHTEKGMVGGFAGSAGETIARVAWCILEVDRFLTLADHADQSFTRGQSDVANGILAQTFRGTQHKLARVGRLQIHRGNIDSD